MTSAEAQQEEDNSASVRLLADLHDVFDTAAADALYTATILDALHKLEDAPWADWYGHPWPPATWPDCYAPSTCAQGRARARRR